MFGMFGIPGFGMTEKMRKEQAERQARELELRIANVVPWTPTRAWKKQLTLQASTWPEWKLFDVQATEHSNVNRERTPEGKFVVSPSGQFLYCTKTLPKHGNIATLQGSRRGDVMFDGPVNIPSLHEKAYDGTWREDPWMSITPMEVMTQRPGTKLARGHTVIAGLGLGWGLVEALKKRTVTKVTLVERSQELVDWILPQLSAATSALKAGRLEVIVGDARDVLATLTADVALIDVFPGYGNNEFSVRRGPEDRFSGGPPKNIPTVWCWGSAPLADARSWF
jgi:hypothetical protein